MPCDNDRCGLFLARKREIYVDLKWYVSFKSFPRNI